MSRIGKKPITIPAGVTITVDGQVVAVKGPKGHLSWTVSEDIVIKQEDGAISLTPRDESTRARAMWGLSRTLVDNMVVGVTTGFEKSLELVGVGYRAAMKGQALSMQLGFSHEVDIAGPRWHHLRRAASGRGQDHRHRQATGRRGRRPHSQDPAAGALQGQGRAFRRRKRSPQGRQEEVGHGAFIPRYRPTARPTRSPAPEEGLANGRPRLSVFRSAKNIYAQVIDDSKGVTIAAASSLEAGVEKGSDKDAAAKVGALVARRALDKGAKDVVFDRGGYIYHGRIKALAEAAREAGLNF